MEAILQNSTKLPTDLSESSNPSTARLLINQIKQLVEDDMKFTVDAFKLIESEIDTELKTSFQKTNFSDSKTIRYSSRTSSQRRQGDGYSSSSKGYSSRKSLLNNTFPDSHFKSDNKIPQVQNRDVTFSSYLKEFNNDENFFSPGANSTLLQAQYSLPSMNEEEAAIFERSEATITSPYRYNSQQSDYEPYSDDTSSKLHTVLDLHPDFKEEWKETMRRILQRFTQDSNQSNKAARQRMANKSNVDNSWSRSFGESSQYTFGTSRQSSVNRGKTILPQLLAFGDNCMNNRRNASVHHDRYEIADERTEKDSHITSLSSNSKSKGIDKVLEGNKRFDNMPEIRNYSEQKIQDPELKVDNVPEDKKESEQKNHSEKNHSQNSNMSRKSAMSQKSVEPTDQLIITIDVKSLPGDTLNNDVTIVDIEETDTVSKSSARATVSKSSAIATDNTYSHDNELTDAISSSLLLTPKTVRKSWSNFEDIASLIRQATPNRRVIVKKIVPEERIKGYNKNCNEKLIFSGNKITHVKTDRKTVCRKYYPKLSEK